MAPQARIARTTLEFLPQDRALEDLRTRIREQPRLRRLSDEVRARGYTIQDRPEETFSIRFTTQAIDDVRPPNVPGLRLEPVREVTAELVGQSASKADAEAAVATASISAGDNRIEVPLLLEAPRGPTGVDFQRARESTVEATDQVIDSRSWWSAWVGCLQRDCAGTCLSSLFTCSGTWAAYLLCVAAQCGGCVLRCTACATCDCVWWCRWAAGCCDR
jgi:hypothetical protein